MNTAGSPLGKDVLLASPSPWFGKRLSLAAILLAFAVIAPGESRAAGSNPLTVNEIVTMLHVGLPSADIERDLTVRHVLDIPDAAGEARLKSANASPRLIELLRGGSYALACADAQAARQRMTAATAAAMTASIVVPPSSGDPAMAGPSQVAAMLRGAKLVSLKNGRLENYDETQLESKKYFAFYYSAHWCGPCRQFTPKLVEFYQRAAQAHPEMEIVFISSDHSAADMQNYMTETGMQWPALRFERKGAERELTKYAGRGIPDLVLMDRSGRVLSDSYHGTEYVGPQQVLADLTRALKGKRSDVTVN